MPESYYTMNRHRLAVAIVASVPIALAILFVTQVPGIAAGALLHPARTRSTAAAPRICEVETFAGLNVTLAGWRCRAVGTAIGTVVYLHGVADNRASAAGWIERLASRGFEVIAYDSRAHGESTGDACTYGFFEKRDLQRVLDTVTIKPVALIGASLGAAVALQTAAIDRRVSTVVAAETFSDLRTIATERAPRLLTASLIRRAFTRAEEEANFEVDAVSPVAAAAHITVPVLLIHGARDIDTPPEHSKRVFDALAGPKRLILVPGVGHNQSLNADVWPDVERWITPAR